MSNACYPYIKEGAQRLRPGESTKARGASVEEKHPTLFNSIRQRPEDITTFGNGHLARDVLIGAVFSATLFRNLSSHVNIRRDIFVFSNNMRSLSSNTSVNSMRNPETPKTQHVFLRPKGAIFVCT